MIDSFTGKVNSKTPSRLLLWNCQIRQEYNKWWPNGALAVENGKIAACGKKSSVMNKYGDYPDINLKNKTVIPGFNDAHLHFYQLGKDIHSCDLSAVNSLKEMQNKINKWRQQQKHSSYQLLRAVKLDDSRLDRDRLPTKKELDKIVNDRPLLVERICYHAACVNSRALKQAEINAHTEDPPGGKIGRNSRGEPDGRLYDSAVDLIKEKFPAPSTADRTGYLKEAGQKCLARGITSVTADDLGAETNPSKTLQSYKEYLKAEKPGPRLYIEQRVKDSRDVNWLAENSHPTGWGNTNLRFGPIKIMLDGSLGAETAALSNTYPGSSNRGELLLETDTLQNLLQQAAANSFLADIHTIGDRAIDTVIKAYKNLQEKGEDITPPRLVHCQLPLKEQIEILGREKFNAIIQPAFMGSDWRQARKKLASDHLKTSYAWKSLQQAGVFLAGSSDAPIEPVNPLRGIHCAVNRQDINNEPPEKFLPREKLSVETALDLFTLAGAKISGETEIKGSLTPGKTADIAVLNADPRKIDSKNIIDLQVEKTFLNGEEVYSF